MPSPEIITYLQSQLATGQTRENLVALLSQNGWQPQDIDAAFVAITEPTPPLATPVTSKPRSVPAIPAFLIVVVFVAGGAGAFYYFHHKKSAAPTPTSSEANATGLVTYVNAAGNYSFKYLPTWKAVSPGSTGVGIVSPETKASPEYASLGIADVAIQANSYASTTKSHSDLAHDYISQATGNTVTPITQSGLSGYSSTTQSSLSIILIGQKNLYTLSFLGAKSLSTLSAGQQIILQSFTEL